MRRMLIIVCILLSGQTKIYSQCPLFSCGSYPQITAINFPDSIDVRVDSIDLEVTINVPGSCPSGYTGRLIIVKEGGAFGPDHYLDTVNAVLMPGTSSNFWIKFLSSYLTDGTVFNAEKKASALTFRGLDDPCNDAGYIDPSPEVYEFSALNCSPLPVITANNLVLSSGDISGNRWYLDGVKLTAETNDTLYITQDGEYMLEVYQNGCHSFDTIYFEGIAYHGSGNMETALVSGATYEWYKDNVLIPLAVNNTYTATDNGIYKVVISYCSNCRKSYRVTAAHTAIFYRTVTDLSISGVTKGNQNHNIQIHPNPAQDFLYIENTASNTQIKILDLNGRQLLCSEGGDINISSLNDGFYIVGIYSERNGIIYKRLIKNSSK